jgi:hypothetical protein
MAGQAYNLKKPPGTGEPAPGGCESNYTLKIQLLELVSNDFVVRFFFHGPLVGFFVVR